MLSDFLSDPNPSQPLSLFSSQQTTASDTEPDNPTDTRAAKLRIRQRPPKLIESAVLCYFAIILLRLPVLSSDIRAWITSSKELPYLQATKHLPPSMLHRLPDTLRQSFEPPADPHKLERFHSTAIALAASYQASFGMVIPPLNTNLLLLRIIRQLCLPLPIFQGVQRLAKILGTRFDFAAVASKKYVKVSEYPEVALMCAVVVTTKLFFPFDDRTRHPATSTEPAAMKMDWEAWGVQFAASQAQNATAAASASTSSTHDPDAMPSAIAAASASSAKHLATTSSDVFSMTDAEVDSYLAWFAQSSWLSERDATQGREADYKTALYAMFPLDVPPRPDGRTGTGTGNGNSNGNTHADDTTPNMALLAPLIAVQASLRPALVVEDILPPQPSSHSSAKPSHHSRHRVLRPGSKYKRWRKWEEVPEVARTFVSAAGEMVSLGTEEIVVAVLQVEMRLEGWIRERRSEGKEGREKEDMRVEEMAQEQSKRADAGNG